MEIGLEIDLTCKVRPKCMLANADSVGFQLACNVHVWAYFEKLQVPGLGQDISCIKFLVVSDFRHVKCNGSPVSLTEKGTVFHKTDF